MGFPDYEAEYDNRGRVPEHPAIFARWARDAAAWRAEQPPHVLRYGPGERQAIELFGVGDGPVVLFVHGGYWQAMERGMFSHVARGLHAHGASVGVVGYDLCPTVTLAEIIAQVRRACEAAAAHTGSPLVVSGHSAGGHLAACMLADPGGADVRAGYSLSGLFELEPLRRTRLNGALRLSGEEAARLSPALWPAPAGKTFDLIVGELESVEFHRQSREMAEGWGKGGASMRYETVPGANHFTVIEPLSDPSSGMVARLLELRAAVA